MTGGILRSLEKVNTVIVVAFMSENLPKWIGNQTSACKVGALTEKFDARDGKLRELLVMLSKGEMTPTIYSFNVANDFNSVREIGMELLSAEGINEKNYADAVIVLTERYTNFCNPENLRMQAELEIEDGVNVECWDEPCKKGGQCFKRLWILFKQKKDY